MKSQKNKKIIAGYVTTAILLVVVVFILIFNTYSRYMSDKIEVKSQYTFYVELNDKYEVANEKDSKDENIVAKIPSGDNLKTAANSWIDEYTSQFTQSFIPSSKGLRKVKIEDILILDDSNKILKITFSAGLRDSNTEFFDSWNAIVMDGRIICEWIIEFNFVEKDDGLLVISAKKISNSEGFSINDTSWHVVESLKEEKKEDQEDTYRYSISNQNLNVTYDGGKTWITVPVDTSALLAGAGGRNTLVAGSYIISDKKTAFLFGGTKSSNDNYELTLIYSDDKGTTWTSSQIAQIDNVTAAYVQFVTDNVGYVVYAYDKTDKGEKVKIMKTEDGGEKWEETGKAPEEKAVNDIGFVAQTVGFVCYEGTNGKQGHMYITRDSGVSFIRVNLPEQVILDGYGKTFSDIFVKYEVPTLDGNRLIAKVYQSESGTYKSGAYAQFISTDFGQRWVFDGYYQKE